MKNRKIIDKSMKENYSPLKIKNKLFSQSKYEKSPTAKMRLKKYAITDIEDI